MEQIKKSYCRIHQDMLFMFGMGSAIFIIYVFVYILRRSFTASTFDGYMLWGTEYKQIIIILQSIGYLISKFCGIKIISELKRNHRLPLIVATALISELSLISFGLITYPFNSISLFFNGLFLGGMWGVLFSYIEGRRFTGVLTCILGVSMIIGSGVAKTFGLYILSFDISPFWMPAVTGIIVLPVFIVICVILDKMPKPSKCEEDIKVKRIPLDNNERKTLIRKYFIFLAPLFVINILCTVLRDIKEDFIVNIISDLNISYSPTLFIKTDTIVALLVLFILLGIISVKKKYDTFHTLLVVMFLGAVLLFSSSIFFDTILIYPFLWLFIHSFGLYIVYLVLQTVLFDRFIIDNNIAGNVGFLIYIADSLGYFFSCIFMLSKTFFNVSINWAGYYNMVSTYISLACIILTTSIMFTLKFKNRKRWIMRKSEMQ